jgi:hypothetical protein
VGSFRETSMTFKVTQQEERRNWMAEIQALAEKIPPLQRRGGHVLESVRAAISPVHEGATLFVERRRRRGRTLGVARPFASQLPGLRAARDELRAAGVYLKGRGLPRPFLWYARPGRALTVCEVCALSDLDNISVRIADVAACLAVLGDRLRDELRSSTFP